MCIEDGINSELNEQIENELRYQFKFRYSPTTCQTGLFFVSHRIQTFLSVPKFES